ncbi:MAG: D-alanyl-D-alanine carboxypeptidase family protein [Lentihominibacter sp.]
MKRSSVLTKITIIALAAALVLSGVTPSFAAGEAHIVPAAEISWEDAPDVSGTSAIMIDAGSGDILYEKNSHEPRDPASVTKILTCLVALETLDSDDIVTIDYEVETVGHVLELKLGERIYVRDLLYGLMVYSANDAAEAIAIEAGGTIENFCEMMNERAEACGAENTNFTNPNGLNNYGQENHRTTAYDLALIADEAMKNAYFRKLVSTVSYTIPATNKSKERKLENTNLCLYETEKNVDIDGQKRPYKYEGNIGIKTGSTGTAGECYCGMAKRGDTELIVVTLNAASAEDRFADAIKLWDYGFSKYYTYNAAGKNVELDTLKVRRGEKSRVSVGIAEDLDITLDKGFDSGSLRTEIVKDEKKITAPVDKGQKVGTVSVYKDGDLVAQSELITLEGSGRGGALSYIGIADEHVIYFLLGIPAALIVLIAARLLYVRHRRKKRQRRKAQRERNIRRRERDREKNPFNR